MLQNIKVNDSLTYLIELSHHMMSAVSRPYVTWIISRKWKKNHIARYIFYGINEGPRFIKFWIIFHGLWIFSSSLLFLPNFPFVYLRPYVYSFLSNFAGPTFIPCLMFIPDSRVLNHIMQQADYYTSFNSIKKTTTAWNFIVYLATTTKRFRI